MLERILALLSKGDVLDRQAMADEIGISRGLLDLALRDLERLGYVRKTQAMSGASCRSCPAASGCHAACHVEPDAKPVYMWVLTPQGGQYLARFGPSSHA